MAQGKTPPPESDRPEHLPDQPPVKENAEELRRGEYDPERGRNLPSIAVLITIGLAVIILVFLFAL